MNIAPLPCVQSLVSQAAEPYKPFGRYAWHFAKGKLGSDPVFAYLVAEGLLRNRPRILDIGCGRGLLASWLLSAQASAARGQWPDGWPPAPNIARIRGIELMANDVVRAKQALAPAVKSGHAEFVLADMCSIDFGQADAVVILDVLHYVSIAAQDDVLQRVRHSLEPGGVLILRVGDADGGLRFLISTWVDHFVTTLHGHHLGKLRCRPLTAWRSALQSLGFTVESRPMSQGTPFANVLLIARLPATA